MKKRVFSALLVLVLTLSAVTLPAGALGSFSDVSDKTTAQNAEVLRLLGVVDGTGNGYFNPNGQLTRAEFCKMTVELLGLGSDVQSYRTMTIFSDVRASHWASGYINLAVRQSNPRLLAGMPDGTFQPDRAITYGEAVTILMRVLGYTDADSGRIWPSGYINLANAKGVGTGLSLGDSAAITRAQAARLFVNVLGAETKGGKDYVPENLSRDSETVTLVSLSGNTVRVSGGKQTKYDLARPSSATVLNGLKGHLLFDKNGKVATFVPDIDASTGTAVSNAAVIVDADKSTKGISALTGGRTDYTVYRNGVLSGTSSLRKNDVVTYDAASNTLYVCDTRVTVYYEACDPSPSAPATIRALGGTTLNVLPTAQESLSDFKPGEVMTILLTADGSVAGAVENSGAARGNALGIVSASGAVQLLCGSTLIDINGKADAEYCGKLVGISSADAKKLTLSVRSGGVDGDLNVREKTLGGRSLAEHVLLYDDGVLVSLGELTESVIDEENITYARRNESGEIDLIVLSSATGAHYGRVSNVRTEERSETMGGNTVTYKVQYITIDNGETEIEKESGYSVRMGDFVSYKLNSDESNFVSVMELTKLKDVSASAWIGTTAVNYGGKTYTVSDDVLCWNRDSRVWLDGDVDAALSYGGTMNLYEKGGVVRAIEVQG